MDAADWDRKYEGRELVYGEAPNATLVEVATTLKRGRALDLASGQGRNAIWLATRGWTVDAVDFSSVALTKASRVAASAPRSVRERLTWVHADVTQLSTEPNYDLVLMFYLHLPPDERRTAVSTAVSALKPDGILMILGHHTANIESGIGGPQEAEILYTPEDLASDIGSRLTVLTAENRYRDVTGGTAIDALLLASRSPLGSKRDRG
ncbi:SAM-dependent methyltransferase [Rhodococcus sp. 06-462-5]|uniref:class I SAM-dependent methyltransferase n=1 Tax=unclassified Rhodococcus (in: high G+C Gram-positive bacteria) TaxID=192944 RepID=UPI000B9AD6E9|nr:MULTISPECIES: class I SAM-dependent methyltransferase [unclassified Rhodococcus (in: high G+C Gram-positive bacteria)]OZC75096.1 SAM-dependent methyltransferase [Rhodococcus sp. 06-462-5]OZE67613.1 SAM-dependent methyltransferase [Rhodococcus sp. 02-925g]